MFNTTAIAFTGLALASGCALSCAGEPVFANIPAVGSSKQVILVVSPDRKSVTAELSAWEKSGGKWRQALPAMPANIGREGLGKEREGDGKSPIGVYRLTEAFGTVPKPLGVRMPYRTTNDTDYWVSDSASSQYNTWVRDSRDPKTLWADFESLRIPQYKYAVVTSWNIPQRVPHKGSAIFLHVWSGPGKPTAGCTAVSEEDMLTILKWLDPCKRPVIAQGTTEDLEQLNEREQ